MPGPGLDLSFEITSYRLDEPGPHEIQWTLGSLRSNVLRLEVVGAAA